MARLYYEDRFRVDVCATSKAPCVELGGLMFFRYGSLLPIENIGRGFIRFGEKSVSAKLGYIIVLLAAVLSACSQTVDFDVRIRTVIDISDEFERALGAEATVVNVPGGVVVPIQVDRRIDLFDLDSSFASILSGSSEVRILSVTYQVTENTVSTIVPSLRVSVAPGFTDQLNESVMIASLPAFQPETTTKETEIPWVPGGREELETAMNAYAFTSFLSGSFTLREGTPIPSGSLVVDVLVTARTIVE